MKQIFLSKKGIEVLDVPSPKIGNKELLVNNHFSCISPGTELSGIKSIQQGVLTRILKSLKLSEIYLTLLLNRFKEYNKSCKKEIKYVF